MTKLLEIYKKLYQEKIFTLKYINSMCKNYQMSKNLASKLVKKRLIKRITPGVYHIISLDENGYVPDPIIIASKLKEKYFLSNLTALYLHNILEEKPNEVYMNSKRKELFHYKNQIFKIEKTKNFFGVEEIDYKGHKIKISNIERTLLDCIKNNFFPEPKSIIKTARKIYLNKKVNNKKMLNYLFRYYTKKTMAKTGYILDSLKEGISIREKDLNNIKKHLGKKVYYYIKTKRRFHFKKEPEHYNRKWKIMLPEEE
ncbi:hypothetical protein JW949_02575 [Candidatus Woesearchaeota archaeon]|nr:hypothetical protein [Candidatus Woesearchaeota archaeon]